ncbi:MAG: flavodoxin family protein [Proteobacteria bacterium]|nr:flavodoxin family protein [Pseudomonadota bacterium]
MKILGISCSPRKKGNTGIMLDEVLKGAEHEGAEVEMFGVAGKKIKPCLSCYSCIGTAECKTKDDMQLLYPKMIEADGIVFGTPIFFYGMTAQMKTVIDRTFALNQPGKSLRNKVGGAVVIAGSLGLIDPLKDLYFYFAGRQMIPANFVGAYATEKGDIEKREQGMKAAWNLGRQMVQIAEKKFEYPTEFGTNFYAFGTHTH